MLFVFVDEDLADSDYRRNFYRTTVAEELAHVVLHREVIEQVTSVEDFCRLQSHKEWYVCERNAKRLAAAVLMPPQELLGESNRIYRQLVQAVGYANLEAVEKHLCAQLSKRFEVSPKAMSFRMNEWPMRIHERLQEAMDARLETLL
jgi:Zn-dependent peptidase ImmA (M78 family)